MSTPQIDGFLNIKIITVVDIQVSTGFKIQVCYTLFYWIFQLRCENHTKKRIVHTKMDEMRESKL